MVTVNFQISFNSCVVEVHAQQLTVDNQQQTHLWLKMLKKSLSADTVKIFCILGLFSFRIIDFCAYTYSFQSICIEENQDSSFCFSCFAFLIIFSFPSLFLTLFSLFIVFIQQSIPHFLPLLLTVICLPFPLIHPVMCCPLIGALSLSLLHTHLVRGLADVLAYRRSVS